MQTFHALCLGGRGGTVEATAKGALTHALAALFARMEVDNLLLFLIFFDIFFFGWVKNNCGTHLWCWIWGNCILGCIDWGQWGGGKVSMWFWVAKYWYGCDGDKNYHDMVSLWLTRALQLGKSMKMNRLGLMLCRDHHQLGIVSPLYFLHPLLECTKTSTWFPLFFLFSW